MTFTGKLYWTVGNSGYVMQSWDSTTGEFKILTCADPASAITPNSFAFGATTILGNGNLLVGVHVGNALQTSVVVTPDLRPTGEVWAIPATDFFDNERGVGYVGYEDQSGVYDPVTGLNWLVQTVVDPGHGWEWNGFDNAGNFVRGLGDVGLIVGTPGLVGALDDAFLGGSTRYDLAASLLGRWLYRLLPYGDGIARLNIDTGQWEGVLLPASPDGYLCHLGGVDDVEGTMITINRTSLYSSSYAGKQGWIEVRALAQQPWHNPVPNGLWSDPPGLYEMDAAPLREYDPCGPGGPTTPDGYVTGAATYSGLGSGQIAIVDGQVIYASFHRYGVHFGYDDNGNTWGIATSFYAMKLADGSIEKLFDVPFVALKSDGTIVPGYNADGYWGDNYTNGILGLQAVTTTVMPPVIPTIDPNLSAELKDLGQRFISTGLVGP